VKRFSPSRLLARPLLGLVWIYSNAISPLIGAHCRYQPTCSEFAADALRRYGAFKGGYLAVRRIGRCHPWGGSGYDPVPDELGARTERERSNTLDHAYAFISRDNRAGGLAHIESHIDNSPDPSLEYPWFFNAMLSWESKDAALFLAQRYLGYLLDSNEDVAAMKLIVRCRLENSLFKPQPKYRERALDIAHQLGHDDMIRFLTSIN
jgi:putative membrane protein insertion efficiency factor